MPDGLHAKLLEAAEDLDDPASVVSIAAERPKQLWTQAAGLGHVS